VTTLPSARTDPDGFMHECRRRMLDALHDYIKLEDVIKERYVQLKAKWGNQVAPIEAGKDIQMSILVADMEVARERVRTYAAVIQANQVVHRSKLSTRYRGTPQPRETT
jgi:phosphoribosylformylglycinamidine (FGAM) synthase PurS component